MIVEQDSREIPIEEVEFTDLFPDHKLDLENGPANDFFQFKIKPLDSSKEEFEFLIRLPYMVVLGDYRPAVYIFENMKEINQLNGIPNKYMECKCRTENHNCYFHKALQFYFDELDKLYSNNEEENPIEFEEGDFEHISDDHITAILSVNAIHKMEMVWGPLKPCHTIELYENPTCDPDLQAQIAFQHDNHYEGPVARDNTGDLLSSLQMIAQKVIRPIEEKIQFTFDFEKEETKQYFFLFSNVTRRHQYPLILKFDKQIFAIGVLDREKPVGKKK